MIFTLTSRDKRLYFDQSELRRVRVQTSVAGASCDQHGHHAAKLMGILNVTPDSFSDGGEHATTEAAVARGLEMIEQGADIVDVGGESTGPGSVDVTLEEELARVIPVVYGLRYSNSDVWISVDTCKAEVARQAIEAGADMVNDVTALRGDVAMAEVVARAGVPVVLMYSKDPTARTTKEPTQYDDVAATVRDFLEERVRVAEAAGVAPDKIILDPGMGAFVSGDPRYSMELLHRLRELESMGFPLLVGASRKGFIEQLGAGGGPHDRLEGSLAAATLAIANGAHLIRAHDVKETKRVMRLLENP